MYFYLVLQTRDTWSPVSWKYWIHVEINCFLICFLFCHVMKRSFRYHWGVPVFMVYFCWEVIEKSTKSLLLSMKFQGENDQCVSIWLYFEEVWLRLECKFGETRSVFFFWGGGAIGCPASAEVCHIGRVFTYCSIKSSLEHVQWI